MSRPKPNTAEIVTPRGTNIGNNIKNDLINQGIWSAINIDRVITVRDAVASQFVSTVNYSFK